MNSITTPLRRIILLAVFHLILLIPGRTQDLPMLSPVFVNSSLYNPAFAGGDFNSSMYVSVINKNSFSKVNGHPVSNIVSGHVPLRKYTIGLGGNMYYKRINFIQNIYASLAFAYHVPFNRDHKLSFGLSSDITSISFDMTSIHSENENNFDPIIGKYANGKINIDFSTGVNFQAEYFSIGGTLNCLGKILWQNKNYISLSSAYTRFRIPVFLKRDLIEPMITYRNLPLSSARLDIGFIYSYKSKNAFNRCYDASILAGIFVGNKKSFSAAFGCRLLKRVFLIYNYELTGRYSHITGCSHEIALQYNSIVLSRLDKYNEYLTWKERRYKRGNKKRK